LTGAMKDPAVLPEDLRDLLDAERELEAPAADAHARLLARLGPLLLIPPGGVGVPGTADAGSSVAGATQTIAHASLRAKLLVPAIAAALGAAGGAGIHAYLTRSPAATHESQVGPGRAETPVPNGSASAPPRQEAAVPEATRPPVRSGSAPAAPPTAASASSSASLRAERLLLESATAALQRGDAPTALSTLRKHARLHPHGALAEEREVLWVKALRAQGDDAAAERRAKDFRRNFPSSLQQGAVDKPGGSR